MNYQAVPRHGDRAIWLLTVIAAAERRAVASRGLQHVHYPTRLDRVLCRGRELHPARARRRHRIDSRGTVG